MGNPPLKDFFKIFRAWGNVPGSFWLTNQKPAFLNSSEAKVTSRHYQSVGDGAVRPEVAEQPQGGFA